MKSRINCRSTLCLVAFELPTRESRMPYCLIRVSLGHGKRYPVFFYFEPERLDADVSQTINVVLRDGRHRRRGAVDWSASEAAKIWHSADTCGNRWGMIFDSNDNLELV